MQFSDSFLQEVADRNEIVDVVSGYVRLTKRSGANLFGLCPFHSEKTPSFSVAPDKQIYHCFGCGKGGGVINFIMEIENLTFPDAVAFLARRAGMELPEDSAEESAVRRDRERLLELNREAARFFFSRLKGDGGAPAQDYIRKRQLGLDMVKRFGLGFAPDSFYALPTPCTTRAIKTPSWSPPDFATPTRAARASTTSSGTGSCSRSSTCGAM